MLLHIMLGVQVLLTVTAVPNESNNGEDMKNNTPAATEPVEPVGDDLAAMMRRYTA